MSIAIHIYVPCVTIGVKAPRPLARETTMTKGQGLEGAEASRATALRRTRSVRAKTRHPLHQSEDHWEFRRQRIWTVKTMRCDLPPIVIGGMCSRPTQAAMRVRLLADFIINYAVITHCNPKGEYSGDNVGNRGYDCLWRGRTDPRLSINRLGSVTSQAR